MTQIGPSPQAPQAMTRLGSPVLQQRSSSLSFEELALPLFDSVYNFAHWLAQNQADAEDLVQETYLKALRGFTSFQPGTNFRAWIFQILKNTFLSSRARTQRRGTVTFGSEDELPERPANSVNVESILLERSRLDAVQSAIQRLPVNFREALLLCDVEEASYRDITEILSIPIGTVMSRLARARKAVRESVGSMPAAAISVAQSQRNEGCDKGVAPNESNW